MTEQTIFPFNLQMFADGGDAGGSDTATDTNVTTDTTTDKGTDTKTQVNTQTDDEIAKRVQSEVDKITAKLGKEKADALAALEQMKKEKMSAEELAKYELEQEKKALADQKKELVDKANRLTGINALTKVNLYDGSDTSTSLLDMVVSGAKEDSEITNRVTAVKAIIDKFVAAEVKKTFQENGRVVNGGDKGSNADNKDDKNNIAAELGKKAAERTKKSNEILDYYYGGKK